MRQEKCVGGKSVSQILSKVQMLVRRLEIISMALNGRIWSIWTARQPAIVGNGHKNKAPLAILAMAKTISH
ncbi:hypothetical protein ACB092_11G229400 [Castanea dentata]